MKRTVITLTMIVFCLVLFVSLASAAHLAYFNVSQERLESIDLAIGKIVKICDLLSMQSQMSYSSDGKYLVFDTIDGPCSSSLHKVESSPDSTPTTIKSATIDYVSCPSYVGDKLVYCRYDSSEQDHFIILGSEILTKQAAALSMNCNSSGTLLCFAYAGKIGIGGVTIWPLAGGMVQTIHSSCERALISPNGKKVLCGYNITTGKNPSYTILALATSQEKKLGIQAGYVVWETDDALLCQTNNKYLVRYRISTGKTQELHRLPDHIAQLAYTPY